MLFLIFVVAKYIPIRIIASTMEVILKRKHAYRYAMKKGFALISSLMIMMLLMLVALAMLSLSSTSTRTTSAGSDLAKAKDNARMALMLAIGKLQTYTGKDTRITAPANILDADAPALTGVWKSWEGTNHDSDGRPIRPDYTVKTKSESASGRFLTWLVSGAQTGQEPLSPAPTDLVSSVATVNTIPLLSSGTLGTTEDTDGNVVDNPGQVHVTRQLVNDEGNVTTGSYAWWVSPENQKVRISHPYAPRSNDVAGWTEMGQSHSSPNPEVFGLNATLADLESHTPDSANAKPTRKAITLNSTELIAASNSANPQQSFHDISTSSIGLLTNSATGGWRKDLSILTEKWDEIYASYPSGLLPLFRYAPVDGSTSTSLVPKPTEPTASPDMRNMPAITAATPGQSNLYPWSNYSVILPGNTTIQPMTYQAASASWQSVVSFATSYKNFSVNSGVVESPVAWDVMTGKLVGWQSSGIAKVKNLYNYKHVQRLHPQIARFQTLIYAKAVPRTPAANPPRYDLKLMFVPIITLWNPYNIGLTIDALTGVNEELLVSWRRSMPINLAVVGQLSYPDGPDSVPNSKFRYLTPGNLQYVDVPGNWGGNSLDHKLAANIAKGYTSGSYLDIRAFGASFPPGKLTFKQGEAKVFSPRLPGHIHWSGSIRLGEGFNQNNILGFEFGVSNNRLASEAWWLLMKNDRLTQPFKGRSPGMGFDMTFGTSSGAYYQSHPSHLGVQKPYHHTSALAPEDAGSVYWPPVDVDEVGYSIGALADGPWVPIFSMSMGPRMTIGTAPGTNQSRPTRGVIQSSPLASVSMVDPVNGNSLAHPANGTFDITYNSMPANSSLTPNLSTSEGFIATGYQSGDGLSRLIMADIPLRPMASLIELQGWNPRGNNPYPPFQLNLIGNSDATPLIPKDDIVPATLSPADPEFNLMHDDAYCANHLLFDDWFVSSIAPQYVNLGGSIDKTIETVYEDFLEGDYILSNRAYRAISEDQKLSASNSSTRVGEIINSPNGDGWLKIASRLEVEGMFNINSTSVDAWRAILGHAKSREEIALYGAAGMTSTTASNAHPVTRGAIASDVEAGSGANLSAIFDNASEFTGFRSLTDAQIDDLAEKIVDQVRLRGPFLSLSEFVNRQLSSNDDLAMAGAIQTAINNLDADPMAILRAQANNLSADTMPAADAKVVGADYAYPEASEGSSAYGAPGWIRQADILRPIAPIISARDDTFTIRAYGEFIDANGNVTARAWCEATVTRTRNFCDPADVPDLIDPPSAPANIAHGRKYEIIAFRWVNEDEV